MANLGDKLFRQWSKAGRQWLDKAPAATADALQRVLGKALRDAGVRQTDGVAAPPPDKLRPPPGHAPAAPALPGQFNAERFANHAGERDYKLYIPSTYRAGSAAMLVVMLHGCTQDADDFATGTGMNVLAEQYACLLLYPQQSQHDNKARCWNWFSPHNQQYGAGEPAIIAELSMKIAARYRIGPERIFIGGMSAGGAMAATMAAQYPRLYRACAIHSGLPHGAAHDLPSALAAMKGGARSRRQTAPADAAHPVPLIVFHGDRDTMVSPRNGAALIEQVLAQASHDGREAEIENGKKADGHRYTRHVYQDRKQRTIAEHWVVHGAAHAWSGGHAAGSYTDDKGPDASREMLRFFRQHSPY